MKKIALFAIVSIVSFVLGLGGLYVAMPYIQPDKVESARAGIDSLRALAADSLSIEDGLRVDVPVDMDLVLADAADVDSLTPPGIPIDEHPRFLALTDSLLAIADISSRLRSENDRLIVRLTELEELASSRAVHSTDIAELTGTLSRLEDNELRSILERVDDATVARLYDEASGRNRTKIVRAMPADRAARLVQRMMGRPDPPPTQPASTTSHPGADES